MGEVQIHGECDERFAGLRDAFAANFEGGEVGAAVAVTLKGRPVVDLWGGFADAEQTRPWERDTIANVYSTTKGIVALCAHRFVEEGRLDVDLPVAHYWPEFAQKGKGAIPVRWLLSHQAGLPAIRRPLEADALYDWDAFCTALAEEEPFWEPGTQHGYHALTFGYLVGEVLRRIDGRTVGTWFREELAEPLGLDFHIGTPPELHARCAEMIPAPKPPPGAPDVFGDAAAKPDSLLGLVFENPPSRRGAVNSAAWREAEIPAGNGHGDARSIAALYGALASDGSWNGTHVLGHEARDRAIAEQAMGPDAVLMGMPMRFGQGFFLTHSMIPFGPNPRAFGHPGAGGSIGFADPDAELGFAYVMNQMQMGMAGDARGFALISAAYDALGSG